MIEEGDAWKGTWKKRENKPGRYLENILEKNICVKAQEWEHACDAEEHMSESMHLPTGERFASHRMRR